MRLRYDEARGVLKLTCPAAMSRRAPSPGRSISAAGSMPQLQRAEQPEPFVSGAIVPLCGEDVRLVWCAEAPRTPQRHGSELRCGGPESGFERRIGTYLKRSRLRSWPRRRRLRLAGRRSAERRQRRRRGVSLGKLLVRPSHPPELASDPGASCRAPIRCRARGRASRSPRSQPGIQASRGDAVRERPRAGQVGATSIGPRLRLFGRRR